MTTLAKLLWGLTVFMVLATFGCLILAFFGVSRVAESAALFFFFVSIGAGCLAATTMWIGRGSKCKRDAGDSRGDDADQNQIVTLLHGLDKMETRMDNLETIIDARPRDRSLDDEFARLKGDRA